MKKTYRIYGTEGHRQKESFNPSESYDWSENGKTRRIEIRNADKTGTNDYTEIVIERDTLYEIEEELNGQLSDGIFENCNTGIIEEVEEA